MCYCEIFTSSSTMIIHEGQYWDFLISEITYIPAIYDTRSNELSNNAHFSKIQGTWDLCGCVNKKASALHL